MFLTGALKSSVGLMGWVMVGLVISRLSFRFWSVLNIVLDKRETVHI
jgi:hypothetical protein